MRRTTQLLSLALTVLAGFAWGAVSQKTPHIGYVFPGGGRQGSTFTVTTGGQFLNGVDTVYVSGQGVRATVVEYARPLGNKQLRELARQLRLFYQERMAALPADAAKPVEKSDATEAESEEIRNHPVFKKLLRLEPKQVQQVVKEFIGPNKKQQPNAQIAETVTLEVTVDPQAAPGIREIRLKTPAGLTNPMRFQVGAMPEVCEDEPFGISASTLPVQDVPVLFNGQITPGDVDRYTFRAKKGQRLVIDVQARQLIPYLADAVPGWFQAVVSVYDAKGEEIAFADDYAFNPDPVLYCKVPADGEYTLEIRDSIYRGREDFVYRVAVGEQPFITALYPLGAPSGAHRTVALTGWNLPKSSLTLNTEPGPENVRQAALGEGAPASNYVPYAVDSLPECEENESNDGEKKAQKIALPMILNGRISRPGDLDFFEFEARVGEEVVAEVYARRLNSPLDSLLRLTDESGNTIALNDDLEDKASGLLTHHADSYLLAKLPKDGLYRLQLSDSQRHGGDTYGYRLRISAPQPDFALRVVPSSINIPTGRTVPICVHALRKDGFNGDILIALKDAPDGFILTGGCIPSGRDSIRMTLTAPPNPTSEPLALHLESRAQINGQPVCHPAMPAEDMMQAFSYRHLVPSQELLVSVAGPKRKMAPIKIAADNPLKLPLGASVQVLVTGPKFQKLGDVRLDLSDPPAGITLQDVSVAPEGLTFTLVADGKIAKAGVPDNLIVDTFLEAIPKQEPDKPAKPKTRTFLTTLPAIPFEIVQP